MPIALSERISMISERAAGLAYAARVCGTGLLLIAALMAPGINVCFSGSSSVSAGEIPRKGEGVTTAWEGRESDLTEPFTAIIGNSQDWNNLWRRAFNGKPPKVDFKRYAVACVFLGHYPGWWCRIAFPQPYESGSTIIVPYQLADLIVELGPEAGKSGQYGSRGQYRMQLVEKKPGFSMRPILVGKPQIPLKNGFAEILEKDRLD